MTRLGSIPTGTRFRVTACPNLTGRLESLGGGCAVVALDTGARKRFTGHDAHGDPCEVEFVGSRRPTWSLGTEVEVIE